MKSVFGNNIIYSIFGESHGDTMGITIHGLPSGLEIDYDFLKSELERRKPKSSLNTKRKEDDEFKIISGVFNGYTTGAPVTILIDNKDIDSSNFTKGVIRPGQSDYTSYISSDGYYDYRSGGHLSGRLTSLIVLAGAISKKILAKQGVEISASIEHKIKNKENDTTGGIVKVVAKNIKAGIGEPFFDSVESVLSHLFFSIPSVKAVEFGLGKEFAYLYGSECIDELEFASGKVNFKENYNGGINGGITNGCDIVSHITFKPISSIKKEVNTVNLETKENIKYINKGRNDSNILDRSLVIVESMMAIGLLELYFSYNGRNGIK